MRDIPLQRLRIRQHCPPVAQKQQPFLFQERIGVRAAHGQEMGFIVGQSGGEFAGGRVGGGRRRDRDEVDDGVGRSVGDAVCFGEDEQEDSTRGE